jgi:nucleoside-diphosphate-sugar epimerase
MVSLVTGGTGFIGGRLVSSLRRQGDDVRALVRDTGRAQALKDQGVALVEGDITDSNALRSAAEGATHVFHCAAILGDDPNPDIRRVNVEGTRELLEACAAAGTKRFIYLSSLAVLGARHHRGTDESATYERARDAYTNTKIEAEQLVRDWGAKGPLETVVLRPGFVYGPGDRLFLPRLIEGLETRRFMFIGDGSKILNLTYVDDLVQALLLARDVPEAAGQVYNLTDGSTTSLREFVNLLSELIGVPPTTRQLSPKLAWAICYALEAATWLARSTTPPPLNVTRMKFLYYNQHYSIEKARRELAYAPAFGYEKGLRRSVEWARQAGLNELAETVKPTLERA